MSYFYFKCKYCKFETDVKFKGKNSIYSHLHINHNIRSPVRDKDYYLCRNDLTLYRMYNRLGEEVWSMLNEHEKKRLKWFIGFVDRVKINEVKPKW